MKDLILTHPDIRGIHLACAYGHDFTVSIVGLTPKTALICPTCGASANWPRATLRRFAREWDRQTKVLPDQDEVSSVRAEIQNAAPLDVATILPD